MASQCLASFRKLSQFMVSQAFARIIKDLQMDFRNHSRDGFKLLNLLNGFKLLNPLLNGFSCLKP